MAELLEVKNDEVKVGLDNGKIETVPIGALRFENPQTGDQVKVYSDGKTTIVKRSSTETPSNDRASEGERRVNKIAYALLTFFMAPLGVQRFLRGQVGLGIFMLLIGWWITLGIWPLVDLIIGLVKLPAYEGDEFVFTKDGRWKH